MPSCPPGRAAPSLLLLLTAGILLASQAWTSAFGMQKDRQTFDQKISSSVVAVRVQKQLAGAGAGQAVRQVLLNGVLVDSGIRPNIIRTLQSNGVAYDNKGHVVCYVGYTWLALNPKEPGVKIELIRADGHTTAASVVGIDQRSGIAVLQASKELQLVPRPISRVSEASAPQECYLVDIEGREPIQEVTLLQSTSAGASRFYLPEGFNTLQGGQLLFTSNAQLWGFVTGRDPVSGARSLMEAQPAQDFLGSVKDILATGADVHAGWLGVYIDERHAAPGTTRVIVTRVVQGSPAELAGITPGDTLLEFDGAPIRSAPEFMRRVRWAQVGSRIRLQLERGNEARTVPVQIAARRDEPELIPSGLFLQVSPGSGGSSIPQIELREFQTFGKEVSEAMAVAMRPRLGVLGDDLTPQLGNYFGVDGGRGVLVLSVVPGSLAERYGIKAGDVIVALNGEPVANQFEFLRILALHGDDPVWNFQLVRERKPIDLKVIPNPPKK